MKISIIRTTFGFTDMYIMYILYILVNSYFCSVMYSFVNSTAWHLYYFAMFCKYAPAISVNFSNLQPSSTEVAGVVSAANLFH